MTICISWKGGDAAAGCRAPTRRTTTNNISTEYDDLIQMFENSRDWPVPLDVRLPCIDVPIKSHTFNTVEWWGRKRSKKTGIYCWNLSNTVSHCTQYIKRWINSVIGHVSHPQTPLIPSLLPLQQHGRPTEWRLSVHKQRLWIMYGNTVYLYGFYWGRLDKETDNIWRPSSCASGGMCFYRHTGNFKMSYFLKGVWHYIFPEENYSEDP